MRKGHGTTAGLFTCVFPVEGLDISWAQASNIGDEETFLVAQTCILLKMFALLICCWLAPAPASAGRNDASPVRSLAELSNIFDESVDQVLFDFPSEDVLCEQSRTTVTPTTAHVCKGFGFFVGYSSGSLFWHNICLIQLLQIGLQITTTVYE